jgi:exodeoxyribonuclease V alpha subunit
MNDNFDETLDNLFNDLSFEDEEGGNTLPKSTGKTRTSKPLKEKKEKKETKKEVPSNQIKCTAKVHQIRYWNNNWGIAIVEPIEVFYGSIEQFKGFGTVTIKGNMARPNLTETYTIIANEVDDPKYGRQYDLVYIGEENDLSSVAKQKIFLSKMITQNQIENLYLTVKDPFEAIKNENVELLVTAKGIGATTALKIIEKFKNNIDYSEAFVALDSYGLTKNIIEKLVSRFGSPQILIEKLTCDPYILADEVEGFGFKKCDEIALRAGMDYYSPFRLEAYIKYFLNQEANYGNSWVEPKILLSALKENIGEDFDRNVLKETLIDMRSRNIIWRDDENKKIALMKYHNLEMNITKELLRISTADNDFDYKLWEKSIKETEIVQGWKFTSQQIEGIKAVLENQVVVISGCAGTGKSSIAKGMLDILTNYSYAMTALSGKAAMRIAEATGRLNDSYTIHRLLAWTFGVFQYNSEFKLPHKIIILDELSMVGGFLFYDLIQAVETGSKLILLGDVGQLEALGGLNIAKDLIESNVIKCVNLTEIHRQAKKSAIVTESLKVREGEQITDSFIFEENQIRGELQDLELDLFDKKEETANRVIKQFKKQLPLVDNILDLQVIVPMKTRGEACTYKLNNRLQEIYNPKGKIARREVQLVFSKELKYIIREGDKVINVKNNYNTLTLTGKTNPIFNGNIGIVKEITEDVIIVDFQFIGTIIVPKDAWGCLELAYAITCHKCVSGDTWIYTNKGVKQLKELDNGASIGEFKNMKEDILVYNGTKLEKPSHFYNDGVSLCKKIHTERGYYLTGTNEHKIDYLDYDGYIKTKLMKDVTENDHLIINKKNEIYFNNITLPEQWQEREGFDVRTVLYNRPKVMSKDFAKFLGYMVADGTIRKHGVKFSKRYKEVSEDFSNVIRNLFGYTVGVNYRKSGDYMCEVSSTDIGSFCLNIDGLLPHNKFVPQCILEASKENQCYFLQALFEDGTVNLKKEDFDHIELSMKSLLLCEQVRMMLLNMGIITTYNHKTEKDMHLIYIYKEDAQIFAESIGFISDFKKKRLEKCFKVTRISQRKTIPYITTIIKRLINKYGYFCENSNIHGSIKIGKITRYMLNTFLKESKNIMEGEKDYQYLSYIYNSVFIDSIKTIEEKEEHTYCLTMPETHKFIQNGFIAGNSQGSQFKRVIIGLDFTAFTMLVREWVYTAITRAQEYCICCFQNPSLRKAVEQSNVSIKQTFLVDFLREGFKGEKNI